MSNNKQETGSPLGCFLTSVAFSGAAFAVENDAAQWSLGVLAALIAASGINLLRRELELGERTKIANTPSGKFGTARFMDGDQAETAGLTDPAGVFLGALDGQMLFFNGKGHGTMVAPARAGKAISFVVPNLLHYQGSAFVTDPKGELAYITGLHRRESFGHKVYVINPWGLHGLPQHRFNPLRHLIELYGDRRLRPGLTGEVTNLALQLIPEPEDARNRYFREGSRKLLRALMLHLATARPDLCTLPELWRLLQNSKRLDDALITMAGSEALAGVVADLAEDIAGIIERSPEAFQSFVEGARQAVAIYEPSGWLAHSVSGSDFSFGDLKTGKVTVYLVIPPAQIGTYGAWLGLLTRRAIDSVVATPGNRRVLFMLDEFANMGKLAGLMDSLTLLPGYGVQLWMIVQSLDQLRAVYGHEATKTILSQSEVKQYFAVQDDDLATALSKALGQITIKTASINLGRDPDDDPGESRAETGRPLMSPDEIRQLPRNQQIVLIGSLPPVRAHRVLYWDVSPWQDWAQQNPYETGTPRPIASYQLTYTEKPDDGL